MSAAIQSRCSLAESINSLPLSQRNKALGSLPPEVAEQLLSDWRLWGRPSQQLPPGDWLFWLILAGRGFGKTRTGSETVRQWARNPSERILMIAPTLSDVREVMIEGPSGLLAAYPTHERPSYNSSRHLVTFPSGAIGITRSADEPERLRGPQFTKFWADELCAWNYEQQAWDQIMFGFRLKSVKMQGLISTTPKPSPTLLSLLKRSDVHITRGSSYENRANLSETYFAEVIKPYEGTRLGRQEINAEVLIDVPGALWTQTMIDHLRVLLRDVPPLVRVVVSIDPAVTSAEGSNETGIGAVGLAANGHCYVLADKSGKYSPGEWARIAVLLWCEYKGDRVLAEVNNGGDLVEANIRAVHPSIPFRAVHASRGKQTRAEPAAALYEQGRVHHVGFFPELESQCCNWVPNSGQESPDRMDWLVWALFDLVLDPAVTGGVVVYDQPVQISRY